MEYFTEKASRTHKSVIRVITPQNCLAFYTFSMSSYFSDSQIPYEMFGKCNTYELTMFKCRETVNQCLS